MTCIAKMATSSTKCMKEKRKRWHSGPSHALRASLQQAAAQHRLTVGLHSCVAMLKRQPEKVMVCLLLVGSQAAGKDQAASNIQHTLLKAFCTENRINIVHINADGSLMRLVDHLAGRAVEEEEQEDLADCSLIVIEHPSSAPSTEDLAWAAACQGGQLDVRSTGHIPSD